jgi:hypothetical protein
MRTMAHQSTQGITRSLSYGSLLGELLGADAVVLPSDRKFAAVVRSIGS